MMVIGDFNGWSNRAATRFHDARQSISALHHLLKWSRPNYIVFYGNAGYSATPSNKTKMCFDVLTPDGAIPVSSLRQWQPAIHTQISPDFFRQGEYRWSLKMRGEN